MSPDALTALELARPTLVLAGYAAFIGLAARLLLLPHVRLPPGLGITIGVGMSVTAVSMVLSYRFFSNSMLPVAPLTILGLAAILIKMWPGRQATERAGALMRRRLDLAGIVSPFDIPAAVAALLVILPVAGYGLTSWTQEVNDFPVYAGSAQVWVSEASSTPDFTTRHPDRFGKGVFGRAHNEKPAVTAMLVLTSELSGVAPYRLLTPIMLVVLFVLIDALLVLCASAFRLGPVMAMLVVMIPTFSIVPMSRIYDAQLGHPAAVALLACLIAILVSTSAEKTWAGRAAVAAVAGVVGAASLGSNFTLATGSGIMLAALVLWLFTQNPSTLRERIITTAMGAAATLVLSAPVYKWYLKSFQGQITGEAGYDIPLASPLAAIGQQISLFSSGPLAQTVVWWGLALAAVAFVVWLRPAATRRERIVDSLFIVAILVNALVVGFKVGWNNYAMHKWVTVFVALAMPPILAYGFSKLSGRLRTATLVLMLALVVSSVAITLRAGFAVRYVIAHDLVDLEDDARLAALDSVDVDLGNRYENLIAALVVPARVVTVNHPTYSDATPPTEVMFLVRRDRIADKNWHDVVALNETYALAQRDLMPNAEPILFDKAHPASRRFLFGQWHEPEKWGTWSGSVRSSIVIDLPLDERAGDVILRLVGAVYANAMASQTLVVSVNGAKVIDQTYKKQERISLRVTISPREMSLNRGRVTIEFLAGRLISPAMVGQADRKWLSFGVAELEAERINPTDQSEGSPQSPR